MQVESRPLNIGMNGGTLELEKGVNIRRQGSMCQGSGVASLPTVVVVQIWKCFEILN